MRSNGLTAPSYSPVADLYPQVAEALLRDLRQRGVAAYTKPVETSSTVGFDAPQFRAVKERLYVDASASATVRELIGQIDPAPDLDNDDLAWAQIVAGYDVPVAREAASWPAQEDLSPPADQAGEAVPDTGTPRSVPGLPAGARPAPEPPAVPSLPSFEVHRIDESFIPPEPPPLPRLTPSQQLAWLGLAGGPLLLLMAALFTVTLPVWLSLAAVIGFVGGFLTLVATMEDRRGPDGQSDDGAVV